MEKPRPRESRISWAPGERGPARARAPPRVRPFPSREAGKGERRGGAARGARGRDTSGANRASRVFDRINPRPNLTSTGVRHKLSGSRSSCFKDDFVGGGHYLHPNTRGAVSNNKSSNARLITLTFLTPSPFKYLLTENRDAPNLGGMNNRTLCSGLACQEGVQKKCFDNTAKDVFGARAGAAGSHCSGRRQLRSQSLRDLLAKVQGFDQKMRT